tara:strand:+ start:4160 stop:4645 length:486 start_codon:yes stop_codon:yes gene_type:complete
MFDKLTIALVLPIISFFCLFALFFITQLIANKKIQNIIFSTLFLLIFNSIFIIIYYRELDSFHIVYLILTFVMNIYIFINMLNLPVSSIQINILRLIKKKNFSEKDLLKVYNDKKIFDIRYKKLMENKVITYNKNKFKIKNNFLIYILKIFLFLRKITNKF